MQNKCLKINEIKDSDQKRWDEFVLNHKASSVYHLFAWKKAIETAYGHKCIYLCAENNGVIQGILPLVCLNFPCIINEMISLPFCDVGNCLAESDQVQDLLLSEAITFFKERGVKKIQLRGDLRSTQNVQMRLRSIETGKVRMLLKLPASSEELFNSFKSKLRSQIRKAKKNGISFLWGDFDMFAGAYHVFSKNMHELGSPVHSKFFLKAILENYGRRSKLGIVEHNGKIIGMGIILIGGDGISIPWASTLREYNRLGPNMLLYWNFLKFSADNGYAFFDFGRSSEGEGTYKFKKQWGAKKIPLVWYELSNLVNHSKKKKLGKSGHPKRVAAIWQKIPLRYANMIGPYLRKYINL
jgi:FemAB-related protein (PEP-CTERM system-associated)